jgi:hypothetical protein
MSDLTIEEKQKLLAALKKARYTGAKRIRFRERDVTYRTDEEMRRAISDLESDIAGSARGPRTTVASFSTGL